MTDKVDVLAANSSDIPNGSFTAYLTELAHEILSAGDPDGDFAAELAAAHERRQAMAKEMGAGRTERAKMARRVLAAQVWGNVRADAAMNAAIRGLEFEFRPNRTTAELIAGLEGYTLARVQGGAA